MKCKSKFKTGDHVQTSEHPGPDVPTQPLYDEAIVIGSYADLYGGDDNSRYTLYVKGYGRLAWYLESQLALLETRRFDLLDQWKAENKDTTLEKHMSNEDEPNSTPPPITERYSYKLHKKLLYSEEGIEAVLIAATNAAKLLQEAGACSFDKLTDGIYGDSWMQLAAAGFLEEKGYLKIVPGTESRPVYLPGKREYDQ